MAVTVAQSGKFKVSKFSKNVLFSQKTIAILKKSLSINRATERQNVWGLRVPENAKRTGARLGDSPKIEWASGLCVSCWFWFCLEEPLPITTALPEKLGENRIYIWIFWSRKLTSCWSSRLQSIRLPSTDHSWPMSWRRQMFLSFFSKSKSSLCVFICTPSRLKTTQTCICLQVIR